MAMAALVVVNPVSLSRKAYAWKLAGSLVQKSKVLLSVMPCLFANNKNYPFAAYHFAITAHLFN